MSRVDSNGCRHHSKTSLSCSIGRRSCLFAGAEVANMDFTDDSSLREGEHRGVMLSMTGEAAFLLVDGETPMEPRVESSTRS